MKLVALALAATLILAGSAFARDKYRGDQAHRYQAPPQHSQILGWNDDSNPPKKIYNWPDQRYYGQHGMMLD